MSESSLSSMPDPDAELVRLCQAGGPDASLHFAQLVDRHSARIRRRAARILGDDCEAEDIVQDVFVNVHRFLDRYRPDRPFSHWLSVVTLNTCRIELRRRAGRDRRHEAYRNDPGRRLTDSLNVDPILREWLDHSLEEMNETTRQCILLRAIDGLSYREISERCDLTEPAAKMRVLRGLRDLRARYEADVERQDVAGRNAVAQAAEKEAATRSAGRQHSIAAVA